MLSRAKILAIAILWLTPAAILACAFRFGWERIWNRVGVHALVPSFADIRGIPGGLITLSRGGDPLVSNPWDPWKRPLNYPRIWLDLFSWLHITDARIPAVALVFCALYLVCISVLILLAKRPLDSFVILAAGLSLAPLFGIERGNTDLFIFSIVLLACVLPSRSIRQAVLFCATALKLFPFVAMAIHFVRCPSRKRLIPGLILAAVTVLLAFQWRDIQKINTATPVSSAISFGVFSIRNELDLFFDNAQRGWTGGTWIVFVCWVAALLSGIGAWFAPLEFDERVQNSFEMTCFSTFGCIYAFAFASNSNWDYRLIFLIPTLPLVLDLARTPSYRVAGVFYIALVLLTEGASWLPAGYDSLVTHAASFVLFLLVVALLVKVCQPILLEFLNANEPDRPNIAHAAADVSEA